MATTPSGTAYTIEEQTGAGGMMRWYVADNRRAAAHVPLLLFVHGNGGTYKTLDGTASGEVRDWLVDNGWAVFEADAGGGSNFGNDAAQAAYIEGLAWVESRLDVGTLAALGVSMGGVAAYWLASQSPFADRVNHVVIQQGVTDLTYRYTATAPGTQVVGNAYGLGWTDVIDMPAWESASDGHDPMKAPLSAWEGKTVLQLTDDADTTVEQDIHGKAWIAKYGGAATVEHVETSGFGHTFHAGHRQPTYAFLSEAITPPPEPDPTYPDPNVWAVEYAYLVGSGGALVPIGVGNIA